MVIQVIRECAPIVEGSSVEVPAALDLLSDTTAMREQVFDLSPLAFEPTSTESIPTGVRALRGFVPTNRPRQDSVNMPALAR